MGWKNFKVAGITFKNKESDTMTRLDMISRYCHQGSNFVLSRDKENKHDRNAIEVRQVFKGGGSILLGYVPKKLAAELAPKVDSGLDLVVKFGMKFIKKVKADPVDIAKTDEDEEVKTKCVGLQLRYEGE